MLMEGKSVDEIVAEMDKKAEILKEKEEKGRKDNEYLRKLNDLNNKLKTAEMLLKAGVVTKKEYDQLVDNKNEIEKEYENHKQNAEKQEVEVAENVNENQSENVENKEPEKKVRRPRTKKTASENDTVKKDKVQKLTDKYVGIIDSLVSEKEKEVMTV